MMSEAVVLTEAQERALEYLYGAEHASTRRIYRTTGATVATLQSLAARGLVEPYRQASYRITASGTAVAEARRGIYPHRTA